MDKLEKRVMELEKLSHEPQNYRKKCEEMEKRIEVLERALETLGIIKSKYAQYDFSPDEHDGHKEKELDMDSILKIKYQNHNHSDEWLISQYNRNRSTEDKIESVGELKLKLQGRK